MVARRTNRGLSLATGLIALAGSAALVAAQPPPPALGPVGVAGAEFPKPDRPVASVVSPTWGEAVIRDHAAEVRQIAARLDLRAGLTVADIGAGDGYDTLRLARLLGSRGRVIAEDITANYLQTLQAKARAQHASNIVYDLGEPGDPRLPPRSIDAAIMVHMYHEIAQPYAMLYNLAPAFKPGGRLGIEELDRPTAAHGTPPALLTCELKAAGYRQLSQAPMSGGLGYFAVFAPPASDARPEPSRIQPCRA